MINPFPLKKVFYITSILFVLFIQKNSTAQQDLTLYNMRFVPQRMYTNPSFRPTDTTIFIGIPILSSLYFNLANTGFTYSDAIQADGDSMKANIANMISKLGKQNYIMASFHTDILSFGLPIKQNYLSFNITERVDFRFGYSQDFFNFLWKGNGDPSIIGQTINLAPSLNAMHYREYGLGLSRPINDKLTIGVKLKYLYGEEDVNTENTSASITTDPNDFALTAQSNVNINTAGIIGNDPSNATSIVQKDNNGNGNNSSMISPTNLNDYLFKKKNNGIAIDLGATYKLNDKLSFAASVNDLGFITWRTATTSYESTYPNATFTYNGIDISEFINNKQLQFQTVLNNALDSAKKVFHVDSTGHKYTTWLTAQTYLSANYKLLEHSTVGGLIYAQIFNGNIDPAFSLSFTQEVGRWFTGSLSYSIYNRSYNNIGAGIAIGGSPVQFYFVSDNILAMFMPQNTKNVMFHFGLNITWLHKHPAPKKSQI